MSKELNKRERIFVIEYAVDQNGTRASRVAGYGNSDRTAAVQAHRLLKRADIAQAIEREVRKAERRAELRSFRKGLTKERWLEELRSIAMADMDDYATTTVKQSGRYSYKELDVHANVEREAGTGRAIKKIAQTKHGIAIELHSKQAALETLGKAAGWLKEHVHHSGGTTDTVLTGELDEAALAQALKKIESEI